MNIEDLLRGTVQSDLQELEEVEFGSEAYKVGVDGITKLTDRILEFDSRASAKALAEAEHKLKQKEMAEEKKDRVIRNAISVAGIVLPICLTVWGTLKTFQFEKEGTVTTSIGRGFINKLHRK